MQDHHVERAGDVYDAHEGDERRGHLTDAPDPADDHDGDQERYDHGGKVDGYGKVLAEHIGDVPPLKHVAAAEGVEHG